MRIGSGHVAGKSEERVRTRWDRGDGIWEHDWKLTQEENMADSGLSRCDQWLETEAKGERTHGR